MATEAGVFVAHPLRLREQPQGLSCLGPIAGRLLLRGLRVEGLLRLLRLRWRLLLLLWLWLLWLLLLWLLVGVCLLLGLAVPAGRRRGVGERLRPAKRPCGALVECVGGLRL